VDKRGEKKGTWMPQTSGGLFIVQKKNEWWVVTNKRRVVEIGQKKRRTKKKIPSYLEMLPFLKVLASS
jgi:hypothetical protein